MNKLQNMTHTTQPTNTVLLFSLPRFCEFLFPVLLLLCFTMLLSLSMQHAVAEVSINLDVPNSPFVDYTNTLSASETKALADIAYELKQDTGAQLQTVVVETTAPHDIFTYSHTLFNQWQLGRAGKDNGVLLVIAKADKLMRIEVGYGLEGRIPDVVAKRIITQHIAPQFKQGLFYQGIESGMLALGSAVRGDDLSGDLQGSGNVAGAVHDTGHDVFSNTDETDIYDMSRWSLVDMGMSLAMLLMGVLGAITQAVKRHKRVAYALSFIVCLVCLLLVNEVWWLVAFALVITLTAFGLGYFYQGVAQVRWFVWLTLLICVGTQFVAYRWSSKGLISLPELLAFTIMVWSALLPVIMMTASIVKTLYGMWRDSKLKLFTVSVFMLAVSWLIAQQFADVTLFTTLLAGDYDSVISLGNIVFVVTTFFAWLAALIISFNYKTMISDMTSSVNSNNHHHSSNSSSSSSSSMFDDDTYSSSSSSSSDDSDSSWSDNNGGSSGGGGASGGW